MKSNSNLMLVVLAMIIIITGCQNASREESEKSEKTTEETVNEELKGVAVEVGNGEAPYLFTDKDGTTYLSWTEEKDSINILQYAELTAEGEWTTPKVIAQGNDWFVNWADYPVIVTHHGNNLAAHYLAKSSAGTYSYDVNVTHSEDAGENWEEASILHDDKVSAEHGFVSMVPYKENYLVTWLDGRNTTEATDKANRAMTIRAAVLSPEGEKLEEWELDNRVCDCCQTAAAITDNGPIVAYRNRSEDEIRDMYYVRWENGQWTEPKPLHNDQWKIAGCPVNGPRLAAMNNTVAATWFSAAEGKAEVKIKFSKDGGKSFGDAIRIDHGKALGRVDVELLSENIAFVTWMEGSSIMGAKVTADGDVINNYLVAKSSESRGSGFPQLTKSGNQLIFAWTDSEKGIIKTRLEEL